MPYEDKTLVCSDCKNEFTFTAGEQEFFSQKGFIAEPKRCKPCRISRRKQGGKRAKDGIYRSPAFEDSAPRHQKIRGRNDGGDPRRGEYRSPSFRGRGPRGTGDYRSPAFREHDYIKPDQEYRSPAFREHAEVNVEEEYRSPGFKEHADINVNEEYRSPGFSDIRAKYRDEKPTFSITCTACGEEAMVPFLPEEKEDPMCQECFAAKRAADAEIEAEENTAPDETEEST